MEVKLPVNKIKRIAKIFAFHSAYHLPSDLMDFGDKGDKLYRDTLIKCIYDLGYDAEEVLRIATYKELEEYILKN